MSASSEEIPNKGQGKPTAHKALRYLTIIAHGSAPFLSTFLLVHLSAPILANFGGSELASKTMLLGREYYQTSFGEKYLLLGPLVVHSLSGLSKRLISTLSSNRTSPNANGDGNQAIPKPRPFSSLLSVTGYSLAFLFLPIHYLTHRVIPTNPSLPIDAFGPSELDYEFVKAGLHKWPKTSSFLYGGLVAFSVLHAVGGSDVIWKTWKNKTGLSRVKDLVNRIKINRRWKSRLALITIVIPTLTGLYAIAKEPVVVLSSNLQRYEAVFRHFLVYRLS
ncbi:hypothetical protein BDN72DRAFT_596050 [Pluteus cervinus]|uniref:Uncharacterized protein n=1 Tax=Pluteus cervinus TaxID=181527 RepID=A0ACD3AVE0_9AGAR|nr:hypothetical protein BDN72DRAFT_596050 [Pluteus cervinus]